MFAAYLKKHGFVGIERVRTRARPVGEVWVDGVPLLSKPLRYPNLASDCEDPDLAEYACLVNWVAAVPREQAKWRSTPKLYTTTLIRASLDGQPETVQFLEQEFGVSIKSLIV